MKWFLAIVLVFFPGCVKPKPKPPTPTPTPEISYKAPTSLQFPELILRQSEGKLTRAGKPFEILMSVACCMDFEKGNNGWPGFSEEWMKYSYEKGANALHDRNGPFFSDVETNYSSVGGPFKENSTEFNQAYWDLKGKRILEAGKLGMNVQVDVIDGWGCKVSKRGDRYNSWFAEDVHACGKTLTENHKAYIRKAVKEFGCYGNVIWQFSNESGLIQDFDPQWELDGIAYLKAQMKELGCADLMVGSNSENDEVNASPLVDYVVTHSRAGIDGPRFNKFVMNNEHNPEYTPEQEKALQCSARLSGQAWAYWRAGQNFDDMEKTLALFKAGCDGYSTDSCPFEVPRTERVGCHPHAERGDGTLYDCTPLVHDGRYCRQVGFEDGRVFCPYRTEGDPFRTYCEMKGMNGEITYTLKNATGNLSLTPTHDGFQFILSGAGTGLVECSVPSNRDNLCTGNQGVPLSVSR